MSKYKVNITHAYCWRGGGGSGLKSVFGLSRSYRRLQVDSGASKRMCRCDLVFCILADASGNS